MPGHLDPSIAYPDAGQTDHQDQDSVRLLSRSPHPYHRQRSDLLEPTSRYLLRERTPTSDSGTEADDEHFLKGLPAPRRLHKGLRTHSGLATPLLTPPILPVQDEKAKAKEIARRLTEVSLLAVLGLFVQAHVQVHPVWHRSTIRELRVAIGIIGLLLLLYPLRLVVWAYRKSTPSKSLPIAITSSFDPAPLLYPPIVTICVSSLLSPRNPGIVLPNMILAICSLPQPLIPMASQDLHWVLSCAPLLLASYHAGISSLISGLSPEVACLLYPLHQSLLQVLHTLTTTSLLTAELQLLSISLIDVLLLASSPQATILRAMLWVGGLDILIACTYPIQWSIGLARVPKWRFKRPSSSAKRAATFFSPLVSWHRMRHDLFHAPLESSSCSSCEAMDDHNETDSDGSQPLTPIVRVRSTNHDDYLTAREATTASNFTVDGPPEITSTTRARRHTLPGLKKQHRSHTHTPSGRRKRTASASVKAFFLLTHQQAMIRKWLYALYVYACIIGTVFLPLSVVGVKEIVQRDALHGDEPVGWALGYLFGDIAWFRWQVVSHNLGRWILLPPRFREEEGILLAHGWVEHLRVAFFGQANTRLLLGGYFIAVIAIGLVVVFRLSPFYEVDTRRKVFHFMMVAMFLPATYIDPAFVALALSIILAGFLLLDLLRASQLPPLSKPLAAFLAPYVDGRDLRGPVVISHIFLLIGCAIPLWLSMGSLGRTGRDHLKGWEVATREVCMVSGIICVGLGDAAASLIGRRYGRRKWFWGGGKSIEGSVAFAMAVFAGLMASWTWLQVGGWTATRDDPDSVGKVMMKSAVCASMGSLTEAVLTGGNDNVIVPVVLWICVKSLGV
ncbi:hypothetical protein F5Y16DRAFT_367850 [Xylariaceae sp. FL0255]|nr:hypothetical protein F5Y16DRAFT_367850 [Xylariaceae sp. FL0255]